MALGSHRKIGFKYSQTDISSDVIFNFSNKICYYIKSEGGTPGMCEAFDFSEEFLVKIWTTAVTQNLVKSDQIYPP